MITQRQDEDKLSSRMAEQQRGLRRMKTMATGLLILMAAAYAVARSLEGRYPGLGLVAAFTEAAMVGALADWFAVVALFGHPLNLPIPKTAVIPRNKDRIGDALAHFLKEHFLTREVLEKRLATVDLAGSLARWLADGKNSARLTDAVGDYLPAILDKLQDRDLKAFVREEIARNFDKVRLAPVLVSLLRPLASSSIHQRLLTEILALAERLLEENRESLRDISRKESSRYIPDFIDEKIFNVIVGRLEEMLGRIRVDPDHEARAALTEALLRFVENLEHSAEFVERTEALRTEMLDHPVVREYIATLWDGVKGRLVKNLSDPDSAMRRQIARSLQDLGKALQKDEMVPARINRWVRVWAATAISENRDSLVGYIAETFKKWDPVATSRRIELQVGKDLQWIRINGTVIGGLVGLLIYTVSWLIRNGL